jgi:hypothetical protein
VAADAEGHGESRGLLATLFCGLFSSSSTIRLTDCLAAFCESEALQGRDQYMCDTCKAKTDAGAWECGCVGVWLAVWARVKVLVCV